MISAEVYKAVQSTSQQLGFDMNINYAPLENVLVIFDLVPYGKLPWCVRAIIEIQVIYGFTEMTPRQVYLRWQ